MRGGETGTLDIDGPVSPPRIRGERWSVARTGAVQAAPRPADRPAAARRRLQPRRAIPATGDDRAHRGIGRALDRAPRDEARGVERNPVVHRSPECDWTADGKHPTLAQDEASGGTSLHRDPDVLDRNTSFRSGALELIQTP